MKKGDLIKWSHPAAESLGLVMTDPVYSDYWRDLAVAVIWFDGRNHGEYPVHHEWMELISESRENS